ncbi:MAG: ABC transporter substrate-binding protein [Candidatus Omnitrophica bacterium]|nr:ABC transporter substrate-binding protein [Candidatus Omnitrophota bacterium]
MRTLNAARPIVTAAGAGLVVILAVFAVAGCHNNSALRPEGNLKRVSIAFQSWVGYGPLYLAQEKGFFKDEGIEMVFVDEQLDSARRDAFKAGMLDFEGGTLDLLVTKRAQDTPVVAVMALDLSYGGDGIVATDDIKKLEDLVGKRVALTRDDVNEMFISYLFYEAGLPLDTMTFIFRAPEDVARAFLDGEADAAVTWEPWLSRALGRPHTHILLSSKDRPGIIIDTLNVRDDLIKNDPRLVKGVMRGWFRAVDYCYEHPAESSAIIAPYYGIKAAEYLNQIKRLKWSGYKEEVFFAGQHKLAKVFDAIVKIKFMNKRIQEMPDAERAINTALLKGLYEDSR